MEKETTKQRHAERARQPPLTPHIVQLANGLRAVGGSQYDGFNDALANQLVRALWLQPGLSEQDHNKVAEFAAFALAEFKPADGIEGMMAAQAVGLHAAALECLRRAMIPDQYGEAADAHRRQAANLTRTFLEVVAALDRKRGKRAQVVRVERVQVAPGGQAIVGTVQANLRAIEGQGEVGDHGGRTGGEPQALPSKQATAAGSPAQLANDAALGTVLPSLRSADPERGTMQVSRDAERAVPDARRP